MSQSRRRRALGAGVVSVGMVAAVAITTAPAMGAPQYTRIDQSSMTAVAADSVENSGEGVNGPIGLVLDGDDSTYWHTQWKDTVAPTPHWFVIKLADKAVDLARVDLTPRQSSNGSGRVHEYKLFAVNTPQCTKDSFGTASPVTSGQFDGLVANKAQVRSIVLDNPVKATCAKAVRLILGRSERLGGHVPHRTGRLPRRVQRLHRLDLLGDADHPRGVAHPPGAQGDTVDR